MGVAWEKDQPRPGLIVIPAVDCWQLARVNCTPTPFVFLDLHAHFTIANRLFEHARPISYLVAAVALGSRAAMGGQDVATHAAAAHPRDHHRPYLLPDHQRRCRARLVSSLVPSSIQLVQPAHTHQLGCTRCIYGPELAGQHDCSVDHVLRH